MPVMAQATRPGIREVYRFGPAGRSDRSTSPISPGHQVRTCAQCGERSRFRLDPEGTWAVCETCGRYA